MLFKKITVHLAANYYGRLFFCDFDRYVVDADFFQKLTNALEETGKLEQIDHKHHPLSGISAETDLRKKRLTANRNPCCLKLLYHFRE